MSPGQLARAGAHRVVNASPTELITHALVVIVVVVCATFLGEHRDLNSGDLLAVFTSAITGTAAVAGARAMNRHVRRTDDERDGDG